MIKKITSQNFKKYGWVIEFPRISSAAKMRNLFRIVLVEPGMLGWRIAYLVVRDKVIERLEQHVESFESFEPVKGESLLYVATRKDPKALECFCLDRPVILKKGIWHGVVVLGRQAEIKITENARVRCIYWDMGFTLPDAGAKPSVK